VSCTSLSNAVRGLLYISDLTLNLLLEPKFKVHVCFCVKNTCLSLRVESEGGLVSTSASGNPQSAVGIATGYGLDGRGVKVSVPGGERFFFRHPDRFWGPSSILSNEYQGLFPLGKAAGTLTSN
jgi:hypothetical protein